MLETQTPNKKPWFLVVSVIAFFVLTVFSGYFKLKQQAVQKQINSLRNKKQQLEQAMTSDLQSGSTTMLAIAAIKDQLVRLEQAQIPWSTIVEKIENTVPKRTETNEPSVEIQSYNGSDEGKVSLSGLTKPESPDSFADIAALIQAFTDEQSLKKVFVPAITKTITPEGSAVLSFSLNFDYHKPTLQ